MKEKLGHRFLKHSDGVDQINIFGNIQHNRVTLTQSGMPARWFFELTKAQAITLAKKIFRAYDVKINKKSIEIA